MKLDFQELNTTNQGCVGLGMAIGYFVAKRYTVSIPLTDNQNYDLVVDNGDGLKKVQVKSTGFKEKGKDYYTVQLRSIRCNRTGYKSKTFDGLSVDWLFVVTEANDQYLIPAGLVHGKYAICLSDKYQPYRITEVIASGYATPS